MKIVFVIPCYNASPNLAQLALSLTTQEASNDWRAIFIDDMSSDDTAVQLKSLANSDDRFTVIINDEKKYALRNIVETVKSECSPTDIVAIIDGDDRLCNRHTVSLLKDAYSKLSLVAWTAHKWDIDGRNISKEMPGDVNPYAWPWCSSHLKTFRASLLWDIPESNFKDTEGRWFTRGYDQALLLPLLYLAKNKRRYIPEVCYQYNINSVSVDDRDWAERNQLSTINIVRARGFLNE